jgi:hypothetical protein
VVHQVRSGRDVGRHAHVDDQHLGTALPGEHVDRGTAGPEVLDHRGGDLLRPRRHSLCVNAVVAGEDGDHGTGHRRRRAGPLDAGQPHGRVLQDAEGTGRLGQLVLPLARRGHRGGVEGTDRCDDIGDVGGTVRSLLLGHGPIVVLGRTGPGGVRALTARPGDRVEAVEAVVSRRSLRSLLNHRVVARSSTTGAR